MLSTCSLTFYGTLANPSCLRRSPRWFSKLHVWLHTGILRPKSNPCRKWPWLWWHSHREPAKCSVPFVHCERCSGRRRRRRKGSMSNRFLKFEILDLFVLSAHQKQKRKAVTIARQTAHFKHKILYVYNKCNIRQVLSFLSIFFGALFASDVVSKIIMHFVRSF